MIRKLDSGSHDIVTAFAINKVSAKQMLEGLLLNSKVFKRGTELVRRLFGKMLYIAGLLLASDWSTRLVQASGNRSVKHCSWFHSKAHEHHWICNRQDFKL